MYVVNKQTTYIEKGGRGGVNNLSGNVFTTLTSLSFCITSAEFTLVLENKCPKRRIRYIWL